VGGDFKGCEFVHWFRMRFGTGAPAVAWRLGLAPQEIVDELLRAGCDESFSLSLILNAMLSVEICIDKVNDHS
jgi:hypothetical protein